MATENYLNGAALQLPFFGEPYGIGTVKRRRNPSTIEPRCIVEEQKVVRKNVR
jgi:hypothetical protein